MGKTIIFFIILLHLASCNKICNPIIITAYNENFYLSKQFKLYGKVYCQLLDTLKLWKADTLAISKPYFFDDNNRLDSLIVFNADSTRCFGNLLRQKKTVPTEDIQAIGGAKIKSKWYFFFCMSTVIDRASYQDSIYAPLTFDELSYLAREHLQNAYTINADSSITTNDHFFDFMYNRSGWGLPAHSTLEQLDSLIVAKTLAIRKEKIDPTELSDIKKQMAESKRPPEPQKEKRSFWDRLLKKEEVKLFESKEWKEYLKKKYVHDEK